MSDQQSKTQILFNYYIRWKQTENPHKNLETAEFRKNHWNNYSIIKMWLFLLGKWFFSQIGFGILVAWGFKASVSSWTLSLEKQFDFEFVVKSALKSNNYNSTTDDFQLRTTSIFCIYCCYLHQNKTFWCSFYSLNHLNIYLFFWMLLDYWL